MSLLRHGQIVSEWSCDSCKRIRYSPVGQGAPVDWEARGDRTFCRACAAELDSNSHPSPTTSCVVERRSSPARQDTASSVPTGPRRERVPTTALLVLAGLIAACALAILQGAL